MGLPSGIRCYKDAITTGCAQADGRSSVASELRLDVGGFAVEADIIISVRKIEQRTSEMGAPVTRLDLQRHAAKMPSLFPLTKAGLSIYPLTATETQLDFTGVYEPSLGALGKALNAVVGHRVAEVSVHRFISDVGEYLRHALA